MMKKNGFTLAEVLITLAIIGVIATMTLPSLISNTTEQQAKSGLKKIVNTLSEAGQMNEAIAGFDFGALVAPADGVNINDIEAEEGQTIYAILRTRTQIDYNITGDGTTLLPNQTTGSQVAGEHTNLVSFKDGTALMFTLGDTYDTENQKISTEDGMVEGFIATVDTNGAKAPNVLSNCASETAASRAGDDDSDVDVSACNSKEKRYIADRFQIKIRGSRVEPVGAAATWALQN